MVRTLFRRTGFGQCRLVGADPVARGDPRNLPVQGRDDPHAARLLGSGRAVASRRSDLMRGRFGVLLALAAIAGTIGAFGQGRKAMTIVLADLAPNLEPDFM